MKFIYQILALFVISGEYPCRLIYIRKVLYFSAIVAQSTIIEFHNGLNFPIQLVATRNNQPMTEIARIETG